MNLIRHRSPKVENNLSNIYFKSPEKKENESNTINFNNPEILSSNKNFNNKFNYNYNIKNYNYYEEIAKAFNFITFVLKQKDLQIKELKIKIKNLENQLSDMNDSNIMTFNNKEVNNNQTTPTNKTTNLNSNSKKINFKISTYNNNYHNKTNIIQFNSDSNKYNQLTHNLLATQIKNISISNKNNKLYDNNNINMANKIKNSTNINKINNYRNNTEISKKSDNNNNNNYKKNNVNSEISNKQININMNINEHSNEKKNINKIRKEPYHQNYQNLNLKNRNEIAKNYKNYTTETDIPKEGFEKIKVVSFEHSMSNLGKPNSKSNSFTLSDDGNIIQSKIEVKNYLKEMKSKLEPPNFKKFITLIKTLIKNKNSEQKNEIILNIKNLIGDKSLITKFENIMKIK